jgi:hypothetical protein
MPNYEFRIPAPYPGAGSPRLTMQGADLIVTFPRLAQDELPPFPGAGIKARDSGKAARDQDPADPDAGNVQVASSPAEACWMKLQQLLAARLGPEDLDSAQTLLQELFFDADPANGGNGGNGNTPAMDRRLAAQSYAKTRWCMDTGRLSAIPADRWHVERAKAGLAILMSGR